MKKGRLPPRGFPSFNLSTVATELERRVPISTFLRTESADYEPLNRPASTEHSIPNTGSASCCKIALSIGRCEPPLGNNAVVGLNATNHAKLISSPNLSHPQITSTPQPFGISSVYSEAEAAKIAYPEHPSHPDKANT